MFSESCQNYVGIPSNKPISDSQGFEILARMHLGLFFRPSLTREELAVRILCFTIWDTQINIHCVNHVLCLCPGRGKVDAPPQWQEMPPWDSWVISQTFRLNKHSILQLCPCFLLWATLVWDTNHNESAHSVFRNDRQRRLWTHTAFKFAETWLILY